MVSSSSFMRLSSLALALTSVAAVPFTEIAERQTTCATGLHLMIGGGCLIPCAADEISLLSTLISNITTAFPGSDEYIVPYDGSQYQAAVSVPKMINAANQYFTDCPNTPVVFIGYSLGGIIVMNTLCGGLDAANAPNVLASITYGEETYRYPEPYDVGTCTNSAPNYPRNNTDQCAPFSSGIHNYCNAADPNCCKGGLNPNAHFTYPATYDVAATDFIKSRYAAYLASKLASSSSSIVASSTTSVSSTSGLSTISTILPSTTAVVVPTTPLSVKTTTVANSSAAASASASATGTGGIVIVFPTTHDSTTELISATIPALTTASASASASAAASASVSGASVVIVFPSVIGSTTELITATMAVPAATTASPIVDGVVVVFPTTMASTTELITATIPAAAANSGTVLVTFTTTHDATTQVITATISDTALFPTASTTTYVLPSWMATGTTPAENNDIPNSAIYLSSSLYASHVTGVNPTATVISAAMVSSAVASVASEYPAAAAAASSGGESAIASAVAASGSAVVISGSAIAESASASVAVVTLTGTETAAAATDSGAAATSVAAGASTSTAVPSYTGGASRLSMPGMSIIQWLCKISRAFASMREL